MNDETSADEINEILNAFEEATSGDKSEDEVKMAMISAGATFKNVTRLFNQYMVDAGLAITKEEKAEIVGKAVKGKKIETEEGFAKVVAAITEAAAGVNEKSAAALIRAWAKAQDPAVECYAKPKGTGGRREGFRSRFFDALIANPKMNKEECTEYLKTAEGTSENVLRHESVFQGIRDLANRIVEAKAA